MPGFDGLTEFARRFAEGAFARFHELAAAWPGVVERDGGFEVSFPSPGDPGLFLTLSADDASLTLTVAFAYGHAHYSDWNDDPHEAALRLVASLLAEWVVAVDLTNGGGLLSEASDLDGWTRQGRVRRVASWRGTHTRSLD